MEINKDLRESSSSEIMSALGSKMDYLTETNQMDVITIYVFMNGQKTKPTRISLLNTELENWSTILSIISKQIESKTQVKW